ncbi:yeats family-domain-containing protein [Pilaira anomala]|nr:yeats family-domain-containing protein [Pilaira anomala]
MIEKRIKITCRHTLVDKNSTHGHIWRNWKVYISPVERGVYASLSYIDHVEYILHESFETPRIVSFEEPFKIQQLGWGEFTMSIIFHFKHMNVPSQTHLFDLNFSKPNYSEIIILKVQEDETMFKSSSRRKRAISSSSDTSSVMTSSSSSMTATPPDIFSLDEHLAEQQQKEQMQVYPHKRSSFSQEKNSCYTFKRNKPNSRSTPQNHNVSSWNNPVSEGIDIPKLATCLESLNDENLRKVYNLLLQYDTKHMNIIETKDQVIFDLYSLGNSLLRKLWEFKSTLEEDLL